MSMMVLILKTLFGLKSPPLQREINFLSSAFLIFFYIIFALYAEQTTDNTCTNSLTVPAASRLKPTFSDETIKNNNIGLENTTSHNNKAGLKSRLSRPSVFNRWAMAHYWATACKSGGSLTSVYFENRFAAE